MSVNLLWVDDNISQFGGYIIALEKAGFKVKTADSTTSARQLLLSAQFDIFFFDLLMPPPNIFEVIKIAISENTNSKIIILSSYLFIDEYRAEVRELGVEVDYLDKGDLPSPTSNEFTSFCDALLSEVKDISDESASDSSSLRKAVYDAVELKPKIFGIGIDLKKLIRKDDST